MVNELLELKKSVIEHLVSQINEQEKKNLGKEFGLSEEHVNEFIMKLLDKWLNNSDFILFLANLFDLSIPRHKENKVRYIG